MNRQAAPGTSRPPAGPYLVPVLDLLHSRQADHGYLTEEDIEAAGSAAGLSTTEIYASVTAYPRFHLGPSTLAPAVCTGPACRMQGVDDVESALGEVSETACLGLCDQPVAVLTSEGIRIARSLQAAAMEAPEPSTVTVGVGQSAFFGDDDVVETAGDALGHPPEELIAAVVESGLQGRGGAGFPTGRKWEAVRTAPGDRKFLVCNADESEPGTFKDRAILDHQPRRLLAGMAIAAHAVGAQAGVIYIRYEYGAQADCLLEEIASLRAGGLLGDGFDIVVRRGAGLYVCGEETALLNSLEGKRPIPRDRPPYPTTAGLMGSPTLIQNVETLAAIPAIVKHGPEWYREAEQPKLYCVSGDVAAPGIFELPMTVTAGELIERAQASVDAVRAFTLGGLSGGLLPPSRLDVRLDFKSPRKYDAQLGSGGVVVLDESRCTVRFALEAMRFFSDESCGKCFPCRIGTTRLRERLEQATTFDDVDEAGVRDVVGLLATGSACGLGPAAALVAQHLLTYFKDDLAEHERGRCTAGECTGG